MPSPQAVWRMLQLVAPRPPIFALITANCLINFRGDFFRIDGESGEACPFRREIGLRKAVLGLFLKQIPTLPTFSLVGEKPNLK